MTKKLGKEREAELPLAVRLLVPTAGVCGDCICDQLGENTPEKHSQTLLPTVSSGKQREGLQFVGVNVRLY